MSTYKTNRSIWLVASAVVFTAIGFLVRFDAKGVDAPLGLLVLDWIRGFLEGSEALSSLPMAGFWIGLWLVVALLVGWLFQSLVVIASSRHERKRPGA